MPPNTKKVDRSTKWGNPYDLMTVFEQLVANVDQLPNPLAATELRCLEEHHGAPLDFKSLARSELLELAAVWAVNLFKRDLLAGELDVTADDVRRELVGFNLACWCPPPKAGGGPDVCHACVLLEVANG